MRWPSLFEKVEAAMEEWIVEKMYTVRLLCSPTQYLLLPMYLATKLPISKLHLAILRFCKFEFINWLEACFMEMGASMNLPVSRFHVAMQLITATANCH